MPSTSPEAISPEKRTLISATERDDISKGTLQLFAAGLGQSELAALLKYDVEIYAITYSTLFKGDPVHASGLVMLPAGMRDSLSIVSLQHGTLFSKDEAPTMRSGLQGAEFLASAGYAAILPDYLGYGISEELFHPYYDRSHSASSVIDLITATREFLKQEGAHVSEKVFLAGYSEGGYVTLAAAREIERHGEWGMKVAAVAAGAGGYDLPDMLLGITQKDYYSYPSYLAYVLMSYNTTYDWRRPLNDFFKPGYAEVLGRYMDGDHGGGFINSRLTTRVRELFNPTFYENLQGTGEQELKQALADNSVSGWHTDVPIRLYHGTNDQIIPYQNSELTLQKFKEAGSANVSLTLLPGKGHSNGFEAMLRDFIPWFLSGKFQ